MSVYVILTAIERKVKLRNRFKEEDKIRFWVDHPFCVLCSSNNQCSLHHIYGCKFDSSKSIINSSMLCHDCHKKADTLNSGGHRGIEFRQDLLKKTLKRAVDIQWEFTDKDKEFLEYVKDDVQVVLNGVK